VWFAEHSHIPVSPATPGPPAPGQPGLPREYYAVADPFVALAMAAAATTRLKLATGICLVPQRNPVYTAKQVVDLDALSRGRVDFGVGAGWLREEFEALGVPFERRGDRVREHIEVMKALWSEDVSEYLGELYQLRSCRMYPKPVQQPHPPIHVGGESDAALRRVADFGWYSFNRAPDDLDAPLRRLEELVTERGRSRGDVMLSVCPYLQPVGPGMVDGYRERGVDRVIGLCLAFDRDTLLASLDQLVTDLLEPASR
jgi:probable F420-dependent oxidoreductase